MHGQVSQEQPRYMSYLLRLWQTSSGGQNVWRASLENINTGEKIGFENLPELCSYLETKYCQSDTLTRDRETPDTN